MPRLVLAVLIAFAVQGIVRAQAAAGVFKDLGPQITATTFIGTTLAREGGRDVFYTVMRGQPAKLVAFDVRTGKLLHVLPMPGADGAWNATTAGDGSVYAGTDANGHLYRYVPGADAVQDLGQVGDQPWVWDICPGEGDSVYISTYPGCRIYRYAPGDGMREVSHGPCTPGEDYARAVCRDPRTGKLYVGVGSHAHLVELDPKTGEKRELLPRKYADQEFVYGTEVLGDHLFACVTNLDKSLVINLKTGKIEAVLPDMPPQQPIVQSPDGGFAYYTAAGHLMRYDLRDPSKAPESLATCPTALRLGWLDDGTLAVFAGTAGIRLYAPRTGRLATVAITPPAEPIVIQSIAAGPDGRVWTAGYLSGGNAAYEPAIGKTTQYKGLSQSESMAALGRSIYFGLYPHGRFAAYDSGKPWDPKRDNPRILGKIDKQSRPYGACAVPQLDKVFWGTIPEYGLLGGGIAEYDPARDKLSFHPSIVPEQSVIALTYSHHLLAGGTTIYGGLGIEPRARDAHLFLWDPETGRKIFDAVPVAGEPIVSCVIEGPDHNLWAMAGGTLVVFDVEARKVLSTRELLPVKYADKHVWRDASMVVRPDGPVYATIQQKLIRIEPATKRVTVLRDHDAALLTLGGDGKLYFAHKTHLWQYTP